MSSLRFLHALARTDSRVIGRDGFLLIMSGYILAITVIVRFALPVIDLSIEMELSHFYPAAVAFIARRRPRKPQAMAIRRGGPLTRVARKIHLKVKQRRAEAV